MVQTNFSLMQRITSYARICEERRTERTIPKLGNTAPRAAQLVGIEHRVREHHRSIAAKQENLAHQHPRPAAMWKEETLVAIRCSQTLEKDFDANICTEAYDTCSKRPMVDKPWSIAPGGRR